MESSLLRADSSMPGPEKKKKPFGDRVEPYSTSKRKSSVRNLEEFEQVRDQFEKFTMSTISAPVGSPPGHEASTLEQVQPGAGNKEDTVEKVTDNSGTDPAVLKQQILNILKQREEPLKLLENFTMNVVISRSKLTGLQNRVSYYNKLKDLDVKLDHFHAKWILYCGLSEEDLEKESLGQAAIEAKLTESGEVIDKAEEMFEKIKVQYPERREVIDFLDFIEKPIAKNQVEKEDLDNVSPSVTVNFGRGMEYLQDKLPSLKTEVETRFKNLQEKFEAENISERNLKQLYKQLESLEEKLDDKSPFEQLLKDAYSCPDYDRNEIHQHKEWQRVNRALVDSLKTDVDEVIDEKENEKAANKVNEKSNYGTFLKKQEVPKFSGDCLDFMEFKRKWSNQVSSHNPPSTYELDRLKENIPVEGQKMLYGVDSLSTAWNQLEKTYGDQSVIVQKLKSRLKRLMPVSKEDHEVMIELHNEIEYLVKRLAEFDAQNLLYYDNEYLNAAYKHLPSFARYEWDQFNTDEFDNRWKAFMFFMNAKAIAALKKRAVVESLKDMEGEVKVTKAKVTATVGATSTDGGRDAGDASQETIDDKHQKKVDDLKQKYGKCKICQKFHYFFTSDKKSIPSGKFLNCLAFKNMGKKQRGESLQKFAACVRCTSWMHKKSECRLPKVTCKEKIDGSSCNKDHSKLVCGSGVAYCTNLAIRAKEQTESGVDNIDEELPTIPYLQDITVQSEVGRNNARTFWDDGSNRVLINNEFAQENQLNPKKGVVVMKTAGGGSVRMDVNLYEIKLVDRKGKHYQVWGYGVDTILEPEEPVDPSKLRKLFPHIPKEVFKKMEKKRIDILIGMNFNSLHPSGGRGRNCKENLKVMKSMFGETGWILGGSHSQLKHSPSQFSAGASQIRVARLEIIPEVLVNDINKKVKEDFYVIQVAKLKVSPELLPEYWDADNLGVEPPKRCTRCRQCAQTGDCSEKHILHSLEEENEKIAIEDNVEVSDNKVFVKYPFKQDPSCLPYNRGTVVKVAQSLERNLKKDNLLEAYNKEIEKYLARGAFVELSKDEIDTYSGPVQYITHHAVLKDSASTPLRVVTNSSFKNGKYSLNDLLPKGPNSLNDMLEVTVRFRSYESVFAYDLSKAYNTMRTGLVERHVRRFVWRFHEGEPFRDFAIDRVHFGDRPAACQLEVSKVKIAAKGRDIDPEAADKLVEDSYVDDGFTGGDIATVERMVGKKDENGAYDGTMSQILALGGYQVKEIVKEGDMEQDDKNLLGNTVFGYYWDAKTAQMKMKICLNLSQKKRGKRVLSDLESKDLNILKTFKMTKRNLLGITNSFGDFLGMAEPFTIRFKLLMKQLYDRDTPLMWDDAISDPERNAWIQMISEAVQAGEHIFPRKTRPVNAVGGPRVVGFGDGAFPAYGGCVYLVWEYSCEGQQVCGVHCGGSAGGGHYRAYLALAKGRVTPLRGFTVPRSEISSAVLVSRMNVRVVRALQSLDQKPVSSIILLDSECTISTLDASATVLKPFFHNRRAEVLENLEKVSKYCEMESVHWVSSEQNSADLLTRGTGKLEDIAPGSAWQAGPDFLSLPRNAWPVQRDCIKVDLPKDELRSAKSFLRVATAKVESVKMPSIFETIDSLLYTNNSLNSRIRVMARVIKGWHSQSPEDAIIDIGAPLSPDVLKKAEQLILLRGMVKTVEAFEDGHLVSLMPGRSGKLIVTRGRLGEQALQPLLGVSELPILMPSSRVAELYMWRAHVGHTGLLHRSVAETLSRSRSHVWIVKGKQLAKKICSQCMECRKEKKQLLSQQMAKLKPESTTVCPPWSYISLDYAGPVMIKGEVNKRTRGKCWILVYICRSTKAVCLLPTSGYDTASFLCRHAEFVARKGRPRTIVSDRGTQLVKSGIVLAEKNTPKGWDWVQVVRRNSASNWEFVPIGAAHRNGLAESTVKILKKSLKHALAPGVVLSYSELVTLLATISFSINCRPLGLSAVSGDSQQEDFLSPITPNQLLLGRTDDDGPPLDYDGDDKYTTRLAYVTDVYNCWWQKWIRQVLPTLMPVKKWKQPMKNLEVGDVVMMYYPGNLKDDYRLAKVLKTHPDSQGLVRTVTIGYRKRDKREKVDSYKSKPLVEEQVAVQRLSLLVPVSDQ